MTYVVQMRQNDCNTNIKFAFNILFDCSVSIVFWLFYICNQKCLEPLTLLELKDKVMAISKTHSLSLFLEIALEFPRNVHSRKHSNISNIFASTKNAVGH